MKTKRKKIIKVGFDLDGVILYNPVRIFRYFITDFFKQKIKKTKEKIFYIPKNPLEKFFWLLLHKTSFMINPGYDDLKKLLKTKKFRFYLITGRYSFLKKDLDYWLKKIDGEKIFQKCFYNKNDLQPPLFKSKLINKLKLDFYVEDNFDIVEILNKKTKTKILWLTNIIDKNISYPLKYLSLKEVVQFLKTLV